MGSVGVGVSTVELSLRMGVALVVVVSLVVLGTGLIRRRGVGGGASLVRVEYQRQLTKQTVLSLVVVGEQQLLVASNGENTTLLAQGPGLLASDPATTASGGSIDIRSGSGGPGSKPAATTTAGAAVSSGSGGGRVRSVNPLKQLQNKTVRRA